MDNHNNNIIPTTGMRMISEADFDVLMRVFAAHNEYRQATLVPPAQHAEQFESAAFETPSTSRSVSVAGNTQTDMDELIDAASIIHDIVQNDKTTPTKNEDEASLDITPPIEQEAAKAMLEINESSTKDIEHHL